MFSRIRSTLSTWARRRRFERDLSSEIETHIDLLTEDLIARGLSPDDARRRARAEFGSVEAAKEGCREATGALWLEAVGRDLRLALRLFKKSPGFTAVVVTILALSIGANAAIFSVVDGVLLRGLPYPESARLVQIVLSIARDGKPSFRNEAQDGATWEVIRDELGFIAPAVYSGRSTGVNLATEDGARYVKRGRVSSGFFETLGLRPALGREFSLDEDRPGGPPVALLSYDLYRSAFHLDPDILGRPVTLRGEPHVVVGVLPDGFTAHVPADLWTPMRASRDGEGQGSNYLVVGRIPEGMSSTEVESRLLRASPRATAHLGPQLPDGATAELDILPLAEALTGNVRLSLGVAFLSVLTILLIGCANVSGLLMARATGRAREVATRFLLGGGRTAILHQLFTEAVLLSLLGGGLGVLLGYGLVELSGTYVRESLGLWQPIRMDLRVLGAVSLLALGSSLAFSLAPAFSTSRVGLREAVSAEGTRSVAGSRSRMGRRALVFFQLAATFVLIVVAGLMSRTLASLNALEPGFEERNLLVASFSLDDERYRQKPEVERLFEQSLERIEESADVESAAIGLSVPYEVALNIAFGLRGEQALTTLVYVTPGYFQTLGMPLHQGRIFDEHDDGNGRDVVVVSRGFAKQFFPDDDAIGSRIDLMGSTREIVGVVSDIQQKPNQYGWGPIGPVPAAYVPVSQFNEELLALAHQWFTPSVVVRKSSETAEVASAMTRAMASVDPLLPFAAFESFDAIRGTALAQESFRSRLLSLFAAIALFLAVTGTSGLIARAVAERKRELGIRLALGAGRARGVWEAAAPGMALAAAGVAAGAIVSRLTVPALESFLWGVSPVDARSFAFAALALLVGAAVASFLPALAVTRLDPATTLRAE